jgi:hypothetical protein
LYDAEDRATIGGHAGRSQQPNPRADVVHAVGPVCPGPILRQAEAVNAAYRWANSTGRTTIGATRDDGHPRSGFREARAEGAG